MESGFCLSFWEVICAIFDRTVSLIQGLASLDLRMGLGIVNSLKVGAGHDRKTNCMISGECFRAHDIRSPGD